MLNSTEEFTKTIEKSENILIIIPPSNSFDSISSSFALYFLLEKMNKSVRIYHSQGLPDRLSFLLQPSNLTDSLSGSRDFKLIFETKKNKIVNVKTEEKDDQYIIHVTPEKGSIDPKDFSFVPAEFKFDMLIISESPSLDSLGNTYYNNTDLFFEVPKINIDYHAGNDNYGQINLVENTASSISEILAKADIGQLRKASGPQYCPIPAYRNYIGHRQLPKPYHFTQGDGHRCQADEA